MGKLPVISGQEAITAFTRAGWIVKRQKGSHVSLAKPGNINILTIPLHKELDLGLLRSQVRRYHHRIEDKSAFHHPQPGWDRGFCRLIFFPLCEDVYD